MIREAELFVTAEQVALWVLARVGREHRSTTVPPPFALPDAPRVTISVVVREHARDDVTVPDLLAGGEPGTDDPLAGGDGDREAVLTRLAEAAVAAATKATDPDAVVHSRYGDISTADYLVRQTVVRAVTAHEVAVFSGSVCPLTEIFSRALWELTEPRADHWRDVGLFGPALTPVPADVSWRDRFLMSAGRDPHPLWDR
ncbi:hypothetical protein [Pseudonocardia sp. N23]|uniref:hypothetical protein n=1 Tax=Pseudonocardia sp. N23 TaxID=1987376 RepID=UPI000BFB193F|nr:hypothetical protein [Pseudonocardia sp. N23]GAY11331.1 hypothetical protein TOK_5840 [Pseudonocardia sp. N23]